LDWVKDYISNRQQVVFINNETSNYGDIKAGVPKVSVLDPLLFRLYVNDITDNLHNLALSFADDTFIQ
jgi:hypothetical protein